LSLIGMPPFEAACYLKHAASLGSSALDLAIAEGAISEGAFITRLARAIGAKTSGFPPPPSAGIEAAEVFRKRSYRACAGETTIQVIAPNAALAMLLLQRFAGGEASRIMLVTRQTLLDALLAAEGSLLAQKAVSTLPPTLSAMPGTASRPLRLLRIMRRALINALLVFALIGWFDVTLAMALPPLLIAPLFITGTLAALTAVLEAAQPVPLPPPVAKRDLPRYSILVPVFRESAVLEALIARLHALDYPRDRLEVFLLIEEEDDETAEALSHRVLPPYMLVLTVPEGMPRTKPRALNAALTFVSGALLVVYDAEDAPEEDQLLLAASIFARSSSRVACLQGRLVISNSSDSFLTRRFALDYAALFDCLKAGAARLGWPVLLGGSSNHFRTTILKRIGAWDAWNVTEDADLGLRLARFGYCVGDLPSSTWEEAPNTLQAWMNQRTRWMKGWMQTLLVHARQPFAVLHALGAFQTMVITTTGLSVLLGALLYPVIIMGLVYRFSSLPLGAGGLMLDVADSMIVLSLALIALVEIIPASIALTRRKALRLMPIVLMAPFSYLLISIAAWRAVRCWLKNPYYWHKTSHGLARRFGGLSRLVNTRLKNR